MVEVDLVLGEVGLVLKGLVDLGLVEVDLALYSTVTEILATG